ncbi:GntP family permease [Hansschlegelia beijingensis]|uniref:GntP family gluconate:H+ symporter n=1 Tax=Hansschlegelia beijingensis TaxID=1133344 RepID=A0A7W6GF12_9HYPH|nr:GntP family permease [Hansschlegelia beijingensis]MBB3973411.1 GntP family gluconate:H+ symporter [Hansschlegelia beijingensis]
MNPAADAAPALSAGPLLIIAAVAVAALLVLIMRFKLHAFLALILVSLVTALVAGIPAEKVVPTLLSGFGTTLGSVALLVGLGAMLGRLVEVSGGAQTLADDLIRLFGEKRAPLALGVASLIFGFPIFFDAGLVVMLPIIFTVARRVGGGLLRYGIPAAGAFSCMHVFVPPHPGPVAATELLKSDIGLVTLVGLVIAIPTWYVTSYLFGLWIGRRIDVKVPDILSGGPQAATVANPPKSSTVILLLLLPLAIIFLNTGLDALGAAGVFDRTDKWFQVARGLGATPIALLIAVLVASYALGRRRGRSGSEIEKLVDSALGPICSITLITGAGGMFGGVLRASGIGGALSQALDGLGLHIFIAAYVIAAALRIAQGSATVALITAAGLVQPAVEAAGYVGVDRAAIVIALGAGSVIASHVNDSGFWLVGRFFEMDLKTTLKTWTVLETLISLMGFALAGLIFMLF